MTKLITRHTFLKDGEVTASYLFDNLTGPSFVQPAGDHRFAAEGDYTTWKATPRRIIGTPTDWRIEARFLSVLEDTTGPEGAAPVNYPMTPYEGETQVLGNVGWFGPTQPTVKPGEWGVLFSSTDYTKDAGNNWNYNESTNPGGLNPKKLVPVVRTVRNLAFRHRVEFRLFSTGTMRVPFILTTETV